MGAPYRGTDGVVKFGGTAFGTLKTFELSIQRARINTTSKGDIWNTSKKGLGSWSGSVTGHLNFANAQQAAAFAQTIAATEAVSGGADVEVIFFLSGEAEGTKFTGNATVENWRASSPGPDSTDPVEFSCDLTGNGAIVAAAVA